MCLVFVVCEDQKECPLRVLFNRDERFDRPTEPLSRWNDRAGIIAGRDLERGGTWAGVTESGRFACVTFVREPYGDREEKRSRGLIVTDFLNGNDEPEAFAVRLQSDPEAYWAYNVLVGEGDSLFYYSNRGEEIVRLESGIHGLSNGGLNSPWPKVRRGKERIRELLSKGAFETDTALELMRERECAPDSELPSTGVPLEKERRLSPLFVTMPEYGTRTTSLIEFRPNGAGRFIEWTHPTEGEGTIVRREERF